MKLDELLDLLYRAEHVVNPDARIIAAINQEIRRCALYGDNQSTKSEARSASTSRPNAPRQPTLL